MNDQKTNTGLRIGISVAMIILMLGLTLFLNAVTTNTISNQVRILSDVNVPISQGLVRMHAIQQIQQKIFEDAIMYHKINNKISYEDSKSQFESYDKKWNDEVAKITGLMVTFSSYELGDDTATSLDTLNIDLNEVNSIHSQYKQNTGKVFRMYDTGQEDETSHAISTAKSQQDVLNLKTVLFNDDIQKVTEHIGASIDESKQKSLTLQTVIIISAGIMSLALGYFLNLINRDLVHEVIRKTRSLQRANKELERLNVLKDDFINIASHELKSPLHPIYGFVELAQNGDIENEVALAGISKQAQQLEEIANRILDVSRINNGMLQLSYEKFDLSNMLNDMALSYKLNIDGRLKIMVDVEEKVQIEADRVRIGQVMRNLINNALKFTEHGIISITMRYSVHEKFVEISVTDTGHGIHQDVLPKLFGKFTTKGPDENAWHGNGLGLYLSKEIVTAHGGYIFAYNNKERGATFKFAIPITKDEKIQRTARDNEIVCS